MTDGRPYASESGKVRRLVAWELVRALLTTVVVVALFYLLPLDTWSSVPEGDHFHDRDDNPARCQGLAGACGAGFTESLIRAIEALAATVPLFIVLFAATYFVMARSDPGNFNVQGLDRTDTLYFAVTIFSTVGFGDIVATSTNGRIVVAPDGARPHSDRPRRPRPHRRNSFGPRRVGPGRLDRPRE